MNDVRAPIYAALSALGIDYELFEHPPVFTAEEAALHWAAIPGAAVKNLFLRNKKGDRHYLVILGIEKQADLRQLVKVIGDDRLSFGSPERLQRYRPPLPDTEDYPYASLYLAGTVWRTGRPCTEYCERATEMLARPEFQAALADQYGEGDSGGDSDA